MATTASMYVDASKTVLLQTARAVVYNPQGSQSSLEVCAIWSYVITTRVKDLQLEPRAQQPTSIITFGSTKRLDQSCEIVQI